MNMDEQEKSKYLGKKMATYKDPPNLLKINEDISEESFSASKSSPINATCGNKRGRSKTFKPVMSTTQCIDLNPDMLC